MSTSDMKNPERSDNDDYRNGYKRKQVNSRYGSMAIEVPQDRKSTFEPQIVKASKDISDIDQKIISMYAKRNDYTPNLGNNRGYLWVRNIRKFYF